jgi:hypothetical protein
MVMNDEACRRYYPKMCLERFMKTRNKVIQQVFGRRAEPMTS